VARAAAAAALFAWLGAPACDLSDRIYGEWPEGCSEKLGEAVEVTDLTSYGGGLDSGGSPCGSDFIWQFTTWEALQSWASCVGLDLGSEEDWPVDWTQQQVVGWLVNTTQCYGSDEEQCESFSWHRTTDGSDTLTLRVDVQRKCYDYADYDTYLFATPRVNIGFCEVEVAESLCD
jgi:hypothetical protein